ncbi:bifunctional folylpolyglutamate synthase/dihydrofolate synthase [Azospirillum brasilense]|uniref:tetrahydrofolate synthase n=1 Tax=Azospirillum brasilense TaxID=192 RepID=A0A0P0E7Q9_AZOBR|nr:MULTISPECIES: folylpolyglutamate synthase/dihydrofolate synthase family protein [Azospirillum]ALJ34224.1 bifunctional folylpolyglutamate synthase/dihydrofolate synthase [Azospirillum brasilense]MDW7552790.1 folylpolyglutamate synthase/dihydrofolate synthase family protein [Azospirillum brasilense]MDW7592018.1 folylpolyglutamate synthase/dihydrofolate synthase family protein [Azospirillum brasilense]MDW7627705.1 folylpolyglutamate synthase/dihydrofolate synthase family protein [Azospirillum b
MPLAESLADPVLDRLKGLHPKVIDLSLDRVHRLLAALDHPERRLPPVVHVAGTNGKGSTLAFLRAMLEAAGLRVHVYTSPHLVRFHERIRLAGSLIDDDRLAALLEECEAANGGGPITFFEVTTVAALLAFAREPADVVLLETGLGGRLDATNVVDRPAVTAITRISYDHRQFLGDTLEAIAGEKAGIFKPGVPAVIFPQPAEEAARTLAIRAETVGAPVPGWSVTPTAGGFRFESDRRRIELPLPGLAGAHQILNAGVALACLDHLPVKVDDAAVRRGLAAVHWPARLQRLTRGPLAEALPAGWDLWLDGGHNDSAGEVLAVQAARWAEEEPQRPLLLVYGMLASKEPREFLGPLAPFVSAARTVAIPGEEASLTAEDTAAATRACGIADSAAAADVGSALEDMTRRVEGPARVLICGSLYLAGTVLAENG